MSDEPVKSADPAPAGAKTSKAVLALLVLNLGASGFATFKLVTATPAAAAAVHEEKKPETSKTAVTGPVVSRAPFVGNLAAPGQSRYLMVTMLFELSAQDGEALLEKNKQVIRDAILSHLSGLKLADTLGAAAKDKLRADVMKKVEEIVGENKVRRMFFQEFVVQ